MTYLISTLIFAVVGTAQLNIFEIEGIFSNAHINALEGHIEEYEYTDDDLLILQYSSQEGSAESIAELNSLLSGYDFPIGVWFGPYKISIDFEQLNNFDYIGFSPGLEINNVSFDESVEKKYCTVNICNFEERKIIVSTNEGIYDNYLIVGTLGSFIENIDFVISDQSIEFFKPSLFERFYIAISNPIFTYMFFVLGFALIGLELFAIGPGLMAVVGSLLVISSTLPFQEFGINYYGILIFGISFLMFSNYQISVNFLLLFLVSVALALFYFVAIPTVIRSRLTTDTSGGTSLVDKECELIEILESETGLVLYKDTKLRVNLEIDKSYEEKQNYIFLEKDGNLYI